LQRRRKEDEREPADIVLGFGSRISFGADADNAGNVLGNELGLALCDRSSMSRGDVLGARI